MNHNYYLCESKIKSIRNALPPDLVKCILSRQALKISFDKTKDLDERHRNVIQDLSDVFTEHPEQSRWLNKNIHSLVGIMSYYNGDRAVYNVNDGKVYEFVMELQSMTHMYRGDKSNLDMPMDYREWCKLILSGKKLDAWAYRR
jgi:hypothetical protein